MIPLRDNIQPNRTPLVNYALIAVTSLVFLAQFSQADGGAELIERFGMIPRRVLHPEQVTLVRRLANEPTAPGVEMVLVTRPAAPAAVPNWATLLTCIFLHGGWMHVVGNMWFLYIFGDNVEDRLGHVGYLVFYLLSGVAASAAHLLAGPESTAPTIGASGAIAAVMGAYLVLYPHAKVVALIPIAFFLQMIVAPAPLFLLVWFALQFFQGALSITNIESTGVAWWAHIGGFVVGVAVAGVLRMVHGLNPPVEAVRPNTEHSGVYRVRSRRSER